MLEYENDLYNQGIKAICGVDEVGRGPLLGPVVAVAVILPEGYFHKDIKDSKKLTEKKREELYERINMRVDIMIENGLEEEVKNLVSKYKEFPTAMQGLGYKEVVQYFDGILTRDEMIEKIKQETRRYAKRQLTWFRKDKSTIWLDKAEGMEKNINTILEEL